MRLTVWSLLEKLIVITLLKRFPVLWNIMVHNTVFTTAHQWPLFFGELSLEKAIDLSQDRQILD
jgi:hypothetical protein